MRMTRIRRSLALVTGAVLLASLITTTVATPAAAADTPSCRGVEATIVGTPGDDRLLGTNGRDVIVGLAGDDIILGRGGNDLICGGLGTDRIAGQRGFDRIYGNADGDRLFGGKGPDLLFGGVGDDLLVGRAGNDGLDGGPGTDACFQNLGTGPKVRCELPKPKAPKGPELISLDANDILAVAYSDIDGLDGYSTGDVLIAKLVDTDPGGLPTIGDTIEMGRYPKNLDATAFGDWSVKHHVVTDVLGISPVVTVETDNSPGGGHAFVDGGADRYFELTGPAIASFQDGVSGSAIEQIQVQSGSPSGALEPIPDIKLDPNATDDDFIDVELNFEAP